MEVKNKMSEMTQRMRMWALLFIISLASADKAFAQGATGIDAASSELATYVDPIGNLMMILGGVVGLVGAIRVYIKWNAGEQDVQKSLMGWLGSCIFLVVSGIIVKAFFGL